MRLPSNTALLVQTALLGAAYAVVRPMASYRAIELGAHGAMLGILAGSFSVLPLLVAFAAGRQIDRWGAFAPVLAGNILIVATGVVAVVADNIPILMAATACIGLGHVYCMVGQQARAAADTSVNRTTAFGQLASAAAVGQIVGPLMAGAAASIATRVHTTEATVGLTVSLAVSVPALIPALMTPRGPGRDRAAANPEPPYRMAERILRTRGAWQAFLASAAVIAAIELLLAYLPLWAHDRNISLGVVGALLALRGALTLLSRVGINTVVERVGQRRVVAASLLAAALGLSTLPFVGIAGAVVVMVVLGFGLGVAQPLTMAWLTDVTPPGARAAALGIRLTANRASQVVVPMTVGLVAAGLGADGVFWAASAILISSCAAMARAPMDSTGDGPEPAR